MHAPTELALVPSQGAGSELQTLEPRTLDEARGLAKDIIESGMFPKLRTPGGALMFILTARDLKLPISVALRQVDVIEVNGHPPAITLRAQLQIALIRRDPRCAMVELENDPTAPGCDPSYGGW